MFFYVRMKISEINILFKKWEKQQKKKAQKIKDIHFILLC